MANILNVIIIILGLLDILSVMLQSPKSSGLSGSITGGAERLFTEKRRDFREEFLFKMTIILSVILIVIIVAKLLFL